MSNQPQPAILPATLPAGTRTRYGNEATSELRLTAAGGYHGSWACFPLPTQFEVSVIDWDLVAVQAAVPAEEDRPIQAGDWVECVRDWGSCGGLCLGERHKVNYAYKLDSGELGVQFENGFTWVASRFKRVDGPHPKDSAEPQRVTSAVATASSVAPAVPDTGLLREQCRECSAPTALRDGLCVYCNRQTRGGESARQEMDSDVAYAARGNPRNVAAERRLEAWSRAEKPRVTNRAQRKQMAAGHPSGWPSCEGEE